MTKISKKSAYPKKTPVVADYFVGTDSEDNLKTVSFGFEETAKLINELTGTSTLNYLFKTSNNIPLEVLTEGVFLSDENETTIGEITKLYVNKKNFYDTDLNSLFEFIATNNDKFLLTLRNSNNLNNTFYFNIEAVTEFSEYFTFDVTTFISNASFSNLVHFNVYFFNFELKTTQGLVGGGISDAPNNANAYVRSGLAWVIGYTKTAIDALISSSLVGYATQSWVNSQGFIINVISALGFTPYNATNPSGFQDASQVQAIADSKVDNLPYNSDWETGINSSPSFANLWTTLTEIVGSFNNELATKQPLSAVLTATTASFTTADETKLDGIATGANVGVIPNTAITGATKTKITYDAKGLVTGGTDANLNDLSDVNISSPATNETLIYDGIGEFRNTLLTSSYISNFNSATRAQVEAELVAGSNITITPSGSGATRQLTIASTGGSSTQEAYSVLANNTASTATPTEFPFRRWSLATYEGTITWNGTAPTAIVGQSYQGQQVGNIVSLSGAVSYTNAGASNTQVIFTLPSNFPIPVSPTGFTGALDIVAYGVGMITTTTNSTAVTGARACFLRRNSANNGYEIFLNISISLAAKVAMFNITYQGQ